MMQGNRPATVRKAAFLLAAVAVVLFWCSDWLAHADHEHHGGNCAVCAAAKLQAVTDAESPALSATNLDASSPLLDEPLILPAGRRPAAFGRAPPFTFPLA